jgi:hypothetical protein
MTTKKNLNLSKNEAVDELWRRGIIAPWKLDSCQKQLYALFKNAKYRKVVWNCSRRLGKSYTLLIIAIEYALQNENSQIKYACFTALAAQKIILPTIREILKDCPEDLKPNYVKQEKCFYFKNGSIIQIEGTDEGNAEKLRGTASHLSILDEAGFMDDLDYVMNDILLPQALTTNGKLLIASTPPNSPAHPFIKLISDAQKHDAYIKKTILDAVKDIENDPPLLKKRLNLEVINEIKESVGGENSATWRREFLCELAVDLSSAVIPEFNEEVEKNSVIEWVKPERFDTYVAMDLGFVDYTGVIFAYLDFRANKLVIEDELWMNGQQVTTKNLADKIREKEIQLWTDPKTNILQPTFLRVSDNDLITLNDLYRLYHIQFIPTRKDDLDTAINEVRYKVSAGQIIIHPRCKNLIYQLKTATWTKNRKTFARSEEAGHFDLIAALVYLVRNVQWQKNPYPSIYSDPFQIFGKTAENVSQAAQTVRSMFNIKKKLPK